MATSNTGPRGMVVTPHHLASQSAMTILRDGGTAVEAAVAAAATVAVVYPHMNSIGGDSFWLIIPPRGDPLVIEACGAAGSQANFQFYSGLNEIPFTGPKAANTVAGTVGGWQEALDYVSECGYQRKSISRLLADAIYYAEHGFPVSTSHEACLNQVKNEELSREFERVYIPNGTVPKAGDIFYQKELARTLKHLAENGLNSFYTGELAKKIVKDMEKVGVPITEEDLANYTPIRKKPLRLLHKYGELLNVPPPTQGLVSLSIIGILDKLDIDGKNEGEFIHAAVEATKQAFDMRDEYITDPFYMKVDPNFLLSDKAISAMAKNIDLHKASPLRNGIGPGDTIWLGVMDNKGFSVSFIQSIYNLFGSRVVLPETGILWHNRGVSFTLVKDHIRSLKPGKKPFHTLNPAAARLNDGRVVVYGTRGGDGQPQTQAAIFHRYVIQNLPLQRCVSDPRWLYGNTCGKGDDLLKLEDRYDEKTIKYLQDRGHKVVMLTSYSESVGHAGMIVRHPNGVMEGAYDPRGNGSAAGF